MIEAGRHKGLCREERICQYCLKFGYNFVEDESHFMQECLMYKDLWYKYLREDLQIPNEHTFVKLFNLVDHVDIAKVAAYIYHSFSRRRELIGD